MSPLRFTACCGLVVFGACCLACGGVKPPEKIEHTPTSPIVPPAATAPPPLPGAPPPVPAFVPDALPARVPDPGKDPSPDLAADEPNPAFAPAQEAVRAGRAYQATKRADVAKVRVRLDAAKKKAEQQAAVPAPSRPALAITEAVAIQGTDDKPVPAYYRAEAIGRDPSFELTATTFVDIVDDGKATNTACHVLIKTSGKYKGKEVWIRLDDLPLEASEKVREHIKKLAAFDAARKAREEAIALAATEVKAAELAAGWEEALLGKAGDLLKGAEATLLATPATLREVRAVAKARAEIRAKEEAILEAARKAEEEYDADGLVLLRKSVKAYTTSFGGEIIGTVVNRRGRSLSYAQVTFGLYNASGDKVGTVFANITQLEPGERWSFKAVTFKEGWTSYRIAGLVGR